MAGLDAFKFNQETKTVDAHKKVRIGIIGTGWIADSHIRSYKKQPDVEIVAGCDLIPGKAEAFFKKHEVEGVKTDYASHKEMLDDESLHLDAVSICTYNRQHAAPAIYALKKGVHVLLEKPMCVTLEEAVEKEREMMAPVRERAEFVINTSRKIGRASCRERVFLDV